MSWAQAGIAGISALGGLLGNRKKTTTSTNANTQQYNNNNLGQNVSQTTTSPVITPQHQALLDQIIGKYTDTLFKDPDLSGYQASGISDINHLSALQKQNAEENMAAHGLSGPLAGTVNNNIDAQRFQGITKLNQSIPLLQRDMITKMLAQGTDIANSIPKGSSTSSQDYSASSSSGTSRTDGTGTQTDPGNMLGGMFGNLGPVLAYLYGQKPAGKTA